MNGTGKSDGNNHPDFVAAIFHKPIEGAKPVYVSFAGDPKEIGRGAWVPKTVPVMDPRKNNYFSLSSFYPNEEGQYRRRIKAFAGLHCIFIDDVYVESELTCGGKIPRKTIKLEPSCRIESSPNNFQVFYILDTPITDAAFAAWFIDKMVHQGLYLETDPGMKGVTRIAKMPFGINGKASVTEFNNGEVWENRLRGLGDNPKHYTVEELAAAYNIDLDEYKPPVKTRPGAVDGDIGIEKYLKFRGGANGVWQHIECPWLSEHSNGRDDGAAYRAPNADPEFPKAGFECHHGHCVNRGMPEVREWAREHGWVEALELFSDETAPEQFDALAAFQSESDDIVQPVKKPNKILSLGDMLAMDIPAPLAVYGDWFRTEGIHMIYAPPGLGKTWVAMQLLNSLGTGESWLDLPPAVTMPDKMMLVDGELPTWLLQERLRQSFSPDFDLDQLQLLSLAHLEQIEFEAEINLAHEKIRDHLETIIEDRGIKVLVLDNMLSLVVGQDNNDMQEMMAFNAWCKRLRAKGMLVIVIHHSNKSGTQFGSQGNTVFVDSVINLAKDAENGAVSFKVQFEKCRLGQAPFQDKPFTLGTDNGLVRSLPVAEVEEIEVTLEEEGDQVLRFYHNHQGETALVPRAAQLIGKRKEHLATMVHPLLAELGYIYPPEPRKAIRLTVLGKEKAVNLNQEPAF